jgi:hypothetical protein
MAAHTPGPWRCETFWWKLAREPVGWRVHAEAGGRIATAAGYESPLADGYLIAAAPDLLAACEAGQRFASAVEQVGWATEGDDSANLHRLYDAWVHTLDHALNRVRGPESQGC